MKDVVLDEVMINEFISKENFRRYFAQKQIITKREYEIYFKEKHPNKSVEKFPTFSRLSFE